LPDQKKRKLIYVIFILFSTTPEKARKRSKAGKDKEQIGLPLVCPDQQLHVGTHVFFHDGMVNTYAGVIKTLHLEEKSCMITYYAWPMNEQHNWKLSSSEWDHNFTDIEGILDDPFEKYVTASRSEYIFEELLHLTDDHHEHDHQKL